jgi:hypothetical protein
MAEQPPSFQFEDIPLDDARRMGRGPRMEPLLYDTLRHKIQPSPRRRPVSAWDRRSGLSG